MQERENIKSELFEIIDNNLISTDFSINETTDLKKDLNLDSMTLVRIILDISDTFNIEIQSNEINAENFTTVSNIIEFIKRKV